jgi:hypothetical protein
LTKVGLDTDVGVEGGCGELQVAELTTEDTRHHKHDVIDHVHPPIVFKASFLKAMPKRRLGAKACQVARHLVRLENWPRASSGRYLGVVRVTL